MEKGEIWLINLPVKGGREQFGLRPSIILADTETDLTLVMPLTSNLQALRFPHTLLIKKSKFNGLESDSVALLFQITAVDKIYFKNKIGELEEAFIKKLDDLLIRLLKIKT